MFKLIVTHISPDLDAIASIWILKRFDKENSKDAPLYFVPAGEQIGAEKLTELGLLRDEVVHVDTGMGMFDHHTAELANTKSCAASLVRDYVIKNHQDFASDKALERMVDHVIDIDHFGEVHWSDSNSDRYIFQLSEILSNLKSTGMDDAQLVEYGLVSLDATYGAFKSRVRAEEEIFEGHEFESKWGKAIALKSNNDAISKFAQKKGFKVVIRKDPDEGHVRIKAVPDSNIDLTPIYEKILAVDSKATWFLHPAKTMLLNGSRKSRSQVASSLKLDQIVNMFEEL